MDQENEFDFFDIDRERLDEEWIAQPKLFFKYASKLADAKRKLEEAKGELDVTTAELDQSIRSAPEKFGLAKVTEGSIKQAIMTQDIYNKANSVVGGLKYKVDMYQAAVSALDHRKRALENLVDLWAQDYWAEPRAKTNSREKIEKESNAKVMERIKIKSKKRGKEHDDNDS